MLNDAQLREFPIDKPWARYNAAMHGPEALGSWRYENDAPARGDPPPCPKGVCVLIGQRFELIPPGNADSDQELWREIAAAADAIIMETRDLSRTAHWYINRGRSARHPTTLTEGGVGAFECLVCPNLYAYAPNVATHGVLPKGDWFQCGSHKPLIRRSMTTPMPRRPPSGAICVVVD